MEAQFFCSRAEFLVRAKNYKKCRADTEKK